MGERAASKRYEGSPLWWMRRPRYLAIFLRELSAFFIISYVLLYLFSLLQLKSGAQSYLNFLQLTGTTPFVFFSLIIFILAIYHTLTWFVLSSSVFPPFRLGNRALSRKAWTAFLLVIWIVSSYFVVVFIFGG